MRDWAEEILDDLEKTGKGAAADLLDAAEVAGERGGRRHGAGNIRPIGAEALSEGLEAIEQSNAAKIGALLENLDKFNLRPEEEPSSTPRRKRS